MKSGPGGRQGWDVGVAEPGVGEDMFFCLNVAAFTGVMGIWQTYRALLVF